MKEGRKIKEGNEGRKKDEAGKDNKYQYGHFLLILFSLLLY
jgi:hypothetical protein